MQPEVRFIAKQNSLMKIGNNGNLVLGPFDESTPCLIIVLMNCQTKLRINHLTAVKSVAILESNANLNFYTWKKTPFMYRYVIYIQWCAKVKDEVEKLAYKLNEKAERTERPIRRLSKVMYGSTCADMQVDVMGECLSSIKHVVGVRSVFLAKRLHAV
ncbi:uncharacterized protein TNCV_380991 [Trichonephila clavipes]|uniref:Uncharacterized protein n=1 Tax=Trichonephila clavipes TaxID=2585209 RepID=A0A8X6VEF4_TRICX|nr:uncharacterized protein TNCV_380991 [Trichonephila clavipes]